MLELRRILFPVDFSEWCSAAASHVAAIARQFHAKVTPLHVIRTPVVCQGDLVSHVDLPLLRNERQVALGAYLQDEFRDVAVIERIFSLGEPARAIMEHAHNEQSDPDHDADPRNGIHPRRNKAQVERRIR